MAQLVAHHTGSVGVTGSSPVSSTEYKTPGQKWPGVLFIFLLHYIVLRTPVTSHEHHCEAQYDVNCGILAKIGR